MPMSREEENVLTKITYLPAAESCVR